MIDREAVVVFMQKLDEFDQKVLRKLDLKVETQKDDTDEKETKSFWRVLVRKGFALVA